MAELKKTSLSTDFKISSDGNGVFTFEATQAGTSAPQVNAMDYKTMVSGKPNSAVAVVVTATGLDVIDAVNEQTDFGGSGNSGVTPAAGIRLSVGKGTLTGGLVLQIGDTSDSYN